VKRLHVITLSFFALQAGTSVVESRFLPSALRLGVNRTSGSVQSKKAHKHLEHLLEKQREKDEMLRHLRGQLGTCRWKIANFERQRAQGRAGFLEIIQAGHQKTYQKVLLDRIKALIKD